MSSTKELPELDLTSSKRDATEGDPVSEPWSSEKRTSSLLMARCGVPSPPCAGARDDGGGMNMEGAPAGDPILALAVDADAVDADAAQASVESESPSVLSVSPL